MRTRAFVRVRFKALGNECCEHRTPACRIVRRSCYSNFQFSAAPNDEINEDSYLCVMDITEGHVICNEGRMTMRIVFKDYAKRTHGWMFP
jgi:hypothetical protein